MPPRRKATSPAADKLFKTGQTIFTKENFTKAFPLFREAAELGHTHAIYTVGKCYLYGHGVEKCQTEAIVWLQQAFNKGFARAGYFLYLAYRMLEMEQLAFTACLKAAEANDSTAQLQTGHNYRLGYGTEKDTDKSTDWYTRAALNKNVQAKHILRERARSRNAEIKALRTKQRAALRRAKHTAT